MRASILMISICLIVGCASEPDIAANAVDGSASFPLQGTSGDVDFILSEDVFKVTKDPTTIFFLISIFFPLFLI